jgi:tetratricopeptide (TPR) repeat protein
MLRVLALVAPILLAALAPAHAQEAGRRPMSAEARARLQEGIRLFEAGEYAAAIAAFRAGRALDPHPDFLYAEAQAEQRRGNCPGAIAAYRAFLLGDPPAAERDLAGRNIERCEEALRRVGATPSATMAEVPPPSAVPPPAAPTPEPRRPWYRDRVGTSLAALGIVGVAGGVSLLWLGERAAVDANAESTTLGDYQRHRDASGRYRTGGLIVGGAGVVLSALSALWYVARPGGDEVGLTAAPVAHGAVVAVAGRL